MADDETVNRETERYLKELETLLISRTEGIRTMLGRIEQFVDELRELRKRLHSRGMTREVQELDEILRRSPVGDASGANLEDK